jgi:stage V sporulation protein SpoVS
MANLITLAPEGTTTPASATSASAITAGADVGAEAVNQTAKAFAIAHGYLERDGLNIVYVPWFVGLEIDGNTRTAIKFAVEVRRAATPPTTVETLPDA